MEGIEPMVDWVNVAVDAREDWRNPLLEKATSAEARSVRSSIWMPCQVLWSIRAPWGSETRVSCGRDSPDIPRSVARSVAIWVGGAHQVDK